MAAEPLLDLQNGAAGRQGPTPNQDEGLNGRSGLGQIPVCGK